MGVSPTEVRFDADQMWVGLSDGRTVGVPLACFPRLMAASPAAREAVEIGAYGLHWGEERPGIGPGDRSQRRAPEAGALD